jgi:hypothetical protein
MANASGIAPGLLDAKLQEGGGFSSPETTNNRLNNIHILL